MEVHFTPEQEDRLSKIAMHEGIDPAELVKDATLRMLEDDARFRAAVRKGVQQADQGQLIEEGDLMKRLRHVDAGRHFSRDEMNEY